MSEYSEELIFYNLACEDCGKIIGKAGHHGSPDYSNDEFFCVDCAKKLEKTST